MDSLTYGTHCTWQASPPFQQPPEGFESSLSSVSWKNMDDPWSYDTEMRSMEEPHFPNQTDPFDRASSPRQSLKQDVFSLIRCDNNLYEEPQSFKPDDSPKSSLGGNLSVCSPADLSPVRSSSTSSLSPSVQSLALIPALERRPRTPDYFYPVVFPHIGPEPTREEIKKNPNEFVHSIFPHADQVALRDRLREVIRSPWWLECKPEPRGFLGSFVKRVGAKVFECHCCRKKLSRADRAVDHFRVHIHHRPFHCAGSRGCGDFNCKMSFMTRDCLKSHTAKHEKICARCGTVVEDKNLGRHQATRKCRRSGS